MGTVSGIQRFAVAVSGALLDTSGRVLLIRERKGARQYGLPGGLVGEYESPEETLVREFALQTDITVAIDHIVGVRYRAGDVQAILIVFYKCRLVSGAARVAGSGNIDEVGWYSTTSLPSPMSPTIAPAIEAASLGGRGMVFEEPSGEQTRRRRFWSKRDE